MLKKLNIELKEFLTNYFDGLTIKKPLFYNHKIGIRFNLQIEADTDEEYFTEVDKRSVLLFESVFCNDDDIYIVFYDYKYKKNKIRIGNYCLKQVSDFTNKNVDYLLVRQLYGNDFHKDLYNRAIVKTKVGKVNYKNILDAIGKIDFPPLKPRIDKKGFLSNKEIFFINQNKKIIFNMYDDRGLDIIATKKDDLLGIYQKYNDWILEYDRKGIDTIFS